MLSSLQENGRGPAGASASAEIREVNLAYLLLAQRLLQHDFPSGLFQTGLKRDVGQTLLRLSVQQVLALASAPTLLCAFRLNDASLLAQLANDSPIQQARLMVAASQLAPAEQGV
jgi:flagellar transcriptional activator FlhD